MSDAYLDLLGGPEIYGCLLKLLYLNSILCGIVEDFETSQEVSLRYTANCLPGLIATLQGLIPRSRQV